MQETKEDIVRNGGVISTLLSIAVVRLIAQFLVFNIIVNKLLTVIRDFNEKDKMSLEKKKEKKPQPKINSK
jgi:hypothetical protein